MSNFYYIVGEEQSAVLRENKEITAFTQEKMSAIHSNELYQVIGNVFGKGEYFPGPDEVLTSIVHELVRRWDGKEDQQKPHCIIITALRLLNGDIDVSPMAAIPLPGSPKELSEDTASFYTFLLHSLPSFQEKFTEKAYAPDSKLVAIIKDAAEFHQLKKQ